MVEVVDVARNELREDVPWQKVHQHGSRLQDCQDGDERQQKQLFKKGPSIAYWRPDVGQYSPAERLGNRRGERFPYRSCGEKYGPARRIVLQNGAASTIGEVEAPVMTVEVLYPPIRTCHAGDGAQ